MQTRIVTTRVYKTEPHNLTNEVHIKTSKMILDLEYVVDYEEYVGDIKEHHGYKTKGMTIVTFEFGNSSDTKVILMEFDTFHKLREDYIAYSESLEGMIKMN